MNSLLNSDKELIKINTLIIGIFIFFFFIKLFSWLPNDISCNGINEWVYTDWLIDYSSGFVRRGLSGELINLLSIIASPKVIIGILTWTIFIGVVFGYIRLLIKSINIISPIILVSLLFLPSLLPFYLYDHDAFGHKEIIGYLFLLWHLHVLEVYRNNFENKISTLNKYIKKLMPLTFVLLPMHIFIYESSLLLFVPIHIIITYSVIRLTPSINRSKRIIELTLIYLPVLLSFFIVFFFGRPSLEVVVGISKKWEHAHALAPGSFNISEKDTIEALPNSITALSWSISRAISVSLSLSIVMILAWLSICFILGLSTIYTGRSVTSSLATNLTGRELTINIRRQYSKTFSYKYFLLPLIISMPLYILGCDIGRWFAVICINYILISLSRQVNFAESKFSTGVELKAKSINWKIITKPDIIWNIKLFLFLFILFFIRLPHWCKDWNVMLAEPIRSIVQKILSKI